MNEVKLTATDATEINKKLLESLENYNKMLVHSMTDIPLGCLCLEKKIEEILFKNGFRRVFDLVDVDLAKIKGLGKIRIGKITSSLNQFLSMG
jgi:hypothetical protein